MHHRPRGGDGASRVPVFCAVNAVTTVALYTPSADMVLMSAWMPAPPPESEPAMESTQGNRRGGPMTGARDRSVVRGCGRGDRAVEPARRCEKAIGPARAARVQ
jgi:hypothetical protein